MSQLTRHGILITSMTNPMLTRGKMTTEHLVRAAAYVDCEGCIVLSLSHKKWQQVTLIVNVANVDLRMVQFMKDNFGGNIYAETPKKLSKQTIYRWKLISNQALGFLEAIRPYLLIKGNQADVAIEFQTRTKNLELRGKPEEAKEYFLRMRGLKTYASPAETKRVETETNLSSDSPILEETPAPLLMAQ